MTGLAVVLACWVPPVVLIAGAGVAAWWWWTFSAWWLVGALVVEGAAGWAAFKLGGAAAERLVDAVPGASWHVFVTLLADGPVAALAAAWHATPAWLTIAVPLGTVAAALIASSAEETRLAPGAADWSDWAHRRAVRRGERTGARAVAKLASTRAHRGTVGRVLERGERERYELDPARWRLAGGWLYPLPVTLGQPAGVIGGPGSGKSNMATVLTAAAAVAGRRVGLLDCKGDAGLAKASIGAYLTVHPGATVQVWGRNAPLDIWDAEDGYQLAGRLIELADFSEPYYRSTTLRILQLALTAPDAALPRNVDGLLERLNGEWLKGHWPGREEVTRLGKRELGGCESRYRTILEPIAALFDGTHPGAWRLKDAGMFVMCVPTMADKEASGAIVRLLLSNLRAYVGGGMDSDRPLTLLVDEFAQIGGGLDAALHVTEQGRGLGCATIMLMQSLEGIGDARNVARLAAAWSAGVWLFRGVNPAIVAALAGTRREQQVTFGEHVTTRYEDVPAIDPNTPLRAAPGEAAVVDGGRRAIVQTPPARWVIAPDAMAAAEGLLREQAEAAADTDETLSAYLRRAVRVDLGEARGGRRELPAPGAAPAELPVPDGVRELPAPDGDDALVPERADGPGVTDWRVVLSLTLGWAAAWARFLAGAAARAVVRWLVR